MEPKKQALTNQQGGNEGQQIMGGEAEELMLTESN